MKEHYILSFSNKNTHSYIKAHFTLHFPLFIHPLAFIRVILNRDIDNDDDFDDWQYVVSSFLSLVTSTSIIDEDVDDVDSFSTSLGVVDWINSCNSSLSSIGRSNELGRPGFVPWRRCKLREYFLFLLHCHWKLSLLPHAFRCGEDSLFDNEEEEEDVFGEDRDSSSGLFTLDLSAQCLWRTQLDPPDFEYVFKKN